MLESNHDIISSSLSFTDQLKTCAVYYPSLHLPTYLPTYLPILTWYMCEIRTHMNLMYVPIFQSSASFAVFVVSNEIICQFRAVRPPSIITRSFIIINSGEPRHKNVTFIQQHHNRSLSLCLSPTLSSLLFY